MSEVRRCWCVVDPPGRPWFVSFDYAEAERSGRPQGYTVMRIDPDGTWAYEDWEGPPKG